MCGQVVASDRWLDFWIGAVLFFGSTDGASAAGSAADEKSSTIAGNAMKALNGLNSFAAFSAFLERIGRRL